MKKLLMTIAVAGLALLAAPKTDAQSQLFGSTVPLTGTTNGNTVATNPQPIVIRPITLIENNITNAATVFIGNVVVSLDKTNWVVVGSFTNSGTNNLYTNMAAYSTNVPVYTALQAVVGTNTVNGGGTYGP